MRHIDAIKSIYAPLSIDERMEAISSGFITNIPIIQIATHNYGSVGLGSRVYEYCTIQSLLNQTHKMVNDENYGIGIPFAWERWVLRDTS